MWVIKILTCVTSIVALQQCFPHRSFIRFYKVRSCYKSVGSIIAWKNFNDVEMCKKFARDKMGLAFNYSPPHIMEELKLYQYKNCQVLGCPELEENSKMAFDPSFDYYTAFGNLSRVTNTTCIKSVGLFSIVETKANYTEATKFCQNQGGDLANILSETRTNSLADMLKSLPRWYKAAYVGLDDTDLEGTFITPLGYQLNCFNFRAWAPGHPRPQKKQEDCVILDSDRVWRAINCKAKFDFICEYFPEAPSSTNLAYSNCSLAPNRHKREKCLQNNELYEIYNQSSRLEKCALDNYNFD